MCQGITDEWCVLPRCTSKKLKPVTEMLVSDITPETGSPQAKAEKQSADIKAGVGYWSTERIRKRVGFYAVKRPLGISFPEGRHSMVEQKLNRERLSSEVASFTRRIAEDKSLSQREVESIMFSVALAADFDSKVNSTSAYLGLLRDDPPLAKRVNNA